MKCGAELAPEYKFCMKCGQQVAATPAPQATQGTAAQNNGNVYAQQNAENSEVETPVGAIAGVWILLVLSFVATVPYGIAGAIVVSLGILYGGIYLVRIKNRTAKTHGIIILVIWVISFVIGFLAGLEGAY